MLLLEGVDNLSTFFGKKVEALIKLGDLYDTFTMKDANTEGETKFVLMVDAEKKVIKNEK